MKEQSTGKERIVRIDTMIGLTMLLVVVGHLSVGFETDWYRHGLHQWIYTFHMAVFVFLSSFLIRYSYRGVNSVKKYAEYVGKRLLKFGIPFVLIGFATAVMACLHKGYAFNGEYLLRCAKVLFVYPRHSEASFLWYIYILMGYYFVSPIYFRLPQWLKTLCCIAALLLAMTNAGPMLCAHDFCQYTFFYTLGVLCAEWIDEIRGMKKWVWAVAAIPFAVYTTWFFAYGYGEGADLGQLGWWTTVTGVAAIPMFYLTAILTQRAKWFTKSMFQISRNCFAIYLTQMFVIWGVVWLFGSLELNKTDYFALFAIVASLLALVLPAAGMNLLRRTKKAGHLSSTPPKIHL